jgi:hypothetical protein
MVSRTVTAIVTASMLTLQWTPKLAYAENQMGYRLLSVQEASRLPRNHGALGVDVERATQITDDGMTFDIIRVKQASGRQPIGMLCIGLLLLPIEVKRVCRKPVAAASLRSTATIARHHALSRQSSSRPSPTGDHK